MVFRKNFRTHRQSSFKIDLRHLFRVNRMVRKLLWTNSKMNQLTFIQNQKQGSQRYLWILLVVANTLLMIDELRFSNASFFLVLFSFRLVELLVAFYVVSAIHFKKVISEELLSLYLLFLIAVCSGFSLFVPSELISRLIINIFFYLLLSASFRGALKDWLQIYMPVASFLLFIPIGLKASYLFHLENLSFLVASFICSNAIVFVRQYLNFNPVSSDTPPSGLQPNSFNSRARENLEADRSSNSEPNVQGVHPTEKLVFSQPEEKSVVQDLFSVEVVECKELLDLINEVVAKKKSRFGQFPRTEITIQTPRSVPAGWGLFADFEELKSMLSQLIEESAKSLGMQTGFVRLSVQFSLRQLHLIIEDNGRGLGKDAILKLKQKGLVELDEQIQSNLSPLEMRDRLKVWGAEFEFATRLGVGRRVCMRFPLRVLAHEAVLAPFDKFQPSFTQNEVGFLN